MSEKVSVPLRGRGDERIGNRDHIKYQGKKFPSPCGEEVMKDIQQLKGFGNNHYDVEFPSPCGEEVMKEK